MYFAQDDNQIRIEAAPGRRGWCPSCGERVVPKCGEVRVWHWAHERQVDCAAWYEPETAWHLGWKRHCDPERVEVSFGEHRADLVALDGAVIELQNSDISLEEIWERERFYGRMIWLLNGAPFWEHLRVERREDGIAFSWSPPRPVWLRARRPIFVHGFCLGQHLKAVNPITRRVETQWKPLCRSDNILQIRTMGRRGLVWGTGRVISVERFVEKMLLSAKC
jgi:hypothetical protein